ncbi:MAG: helix-turn-helix transcriptional regulator [Thiofilum sp.]|uniref:helix-turn-helix domain-containing protein n=1 Tax=Thiofilum sp. TaxID=2212733 RepID=UPI0025E0A64D|nr:helix-turn-helix transcriptional regulator [Thiofilum sp.]MBK8455326.1 helix-turn-helix transcriptional regulator [Thiofilum sp.]
MDISNTIKLCRTARGLSQTELAEKVGVSTSYISLIEQGKRDISMSMLSNLAKGLDAPVEILLFMAADKDQIRNLDSQLADDISMAILDLLSIKKPKKQEADTPEVVKKEETCS